MNDRVQDNQSKRAYEKPAIERIDLAADEVLSTGCKTEAGGPSAGNPPLPGCALSGCSTVGS